eukprot:7376787-Prymnesium_polylepis.1
MLRSRHTISWDHDCKYSIAFGGEGGGFFARCASEFMLDARDLREHRDCAVSSAPFSRTLNLLNLPVLDVRADKN